MTTLLQEIQAKCSPELIAAKEHGQIAAILNTNRYRYTTHMVSERGVRAKLGPVVGAKFIRLLEALSAAAPINNTPVWLTTVLTAANVPVEDHIYYLDTLGCGIDWLRSDGIDVGDATTQSLLDLIAAGNPELATGILSLKDLAKVADVVSNEMVIEALRGL